MKERNPHNWCSKTCHPGPGRSCDQFPPHDITWQCQYCGAEGTLDELDDIECSHVYPPCKDCGQTPTCVRDCKGIARALGRADVAVVATCENCKQRRADFHNGVISTCTECAGGWVDVVVRY